MKTFFKPGSWHEIYQRPFSFEVREGLAKLIHCERDQTQFDYPRLIVEEWQVRFIGDEYGVSRTIAARKP